MKISKLLRLRFSRYDLIIFLIIIIASWFRIYLLGQSSLWYDETYTWWCTQKSWLSMFEALRNPGGELPLYYIGVKLVVSMLGTTDEWALRLLSAIAGVLTVVLAMKIGEILAGRAGMMAAGWFLAFHPMAIWYSRDVKTYSLTLAIASGLFIVYLNLWDRSKRANWIIGLILLILGFMSHYYFFVYAGALILVSLTKLRTDRVFFRRWVLMTFIGLIPLVLWLAWFIMQPEPSLGSGWIQKPDWNDPFETFWNLSSGYGGVASLPTTLFGLIVILVIIGGILTRSRNVISSSTLLVLGISIPMIGVWLVSQFRPLYVDRYFIVFLPLITALFASGSGVVWNKVQNFLVFRNVSWLLPVFILASLSLLGLYTSWHTLNGDKYRRENWRELVLDLEGRVESKPLIWFSDEITIISFIYYFKNEFEPIFSETTPYCITPCWWVIRQPFTYTHAYTQSVNPSNRPWRPELPARCEILDQWDYSSGILLWQVVCQEN